MDKDLIKLDTRQSLLTIIGHPVTKVRCDEHGIIILERYQADPLPVNPTSPKVSRDVALLRADGVMDEARKSINPDVVRKMPISESGIGLTYQELFEQTYYAAKESKEIEKAQKQKAKEKAIKYKIDLN